MTTPKLKSNIIQALLQWRKQMSIVKECRKYGTPDCNSAELELRNRAEELGGAVIIYYADITEFDLLKIAQVNDMFEVDRLRSELRAIRSIVHDTNYDEIIAMIDKALEEREGDGR